MLIIAIYIYIYGIATAVIKVLPSMAGTRAGAIPTMATADGTGGRLPDGGNMPQCRSRPARSDARREGGRAVAAPRPERGEQVGARRHEHPRGERAAGREEEGATEGRPGAKRPAARKRETPGETHRRQRRRTTEDAGTPRERRDGRSDEGDPNGGRGRGEARRPNGGHRTGRGWRGARRAARRERGQGARPSRQLAVRSLSARCALDARSARQRARGCGGEAIPPDQATSGCGPLSPGCMRWGSWPSWPYS